MAGHGVATMLWFSLHNMQILLKALGDYPPFGMSTYQRSAQTKKEY